MSFRGLPLIAVIAGASAPCPLLPLSLPYPLSVSLRQAFYKKDPSFPSSSTYTTLHRLLLPLSSLARPVCSLPFGFPSSFSVVLILAGIFIFKFPRCSTADWQWVSRRVLESTAVWVLSPPESAVFFSRGSPFSRGDQPSFGWCC